MNDPIIRGPASVHVFRPEAILEGGDGWQFVGRSQVELRTTAFINEWPRIERGLNRYRWAGATARDYRGTVVETCSGMTFWCLLVVDDWFVRAFHRNDIIHSPLNGQAFLDDLLRMARTRVTWLSMPIHDEGAPWVK